MGQEKRKVETGFRYIKSNRAFYFPEESTMPKLRWRNGFYKHDK